MQKNLKKINLNEEKKSGSREGNWTRDSSNFSKAIGIWPKRYNHLATQPLVFKCSKLENWSIFNYISLNKGSKIHFLSISSHLHPTGPMPSWCFLKKCNFSYKALFCSNMLIHFGFIRFNSEFLGPIMRLFAMRRLKVSWFDPRQSEWVSHDQLAPEGCQSKIWFR